MYGKKIKIADLINATETEQKQWMNELTGFVNDVMSEDNIDHEGNSVSKSQKNVWLDCFKFIQNNLAKLDASLRNYEFIFEYSMPGTVHERPDVLLLTNSKIILLEFKKKEAPQIDDNKDDVAQTIRYKEWLKNHHEVTKNKSMVVKSYLVCTHSNAMSGSLRGIDVLNKDNFKAVIEKELNEEQLCTFQDDWLDSSKTEMPDMLKAIEIMYGEGRIPYISDVNKMCLDSVLNYIEDAKNNHKKILILINGVPGAGKTAVGQSVVYEQNKNGEANAVYLSGNGPLVEVLQYQIDNVGKGAHIGENAIQGMKSFKSEYFDKSSRANTKVPEQLILIFDEAQRAWDAEKLGSGFSEPEGLFRVGERIFTKKGYAVLIGLYGNGQVIHKGEEQGISLWNDALKEHAEWDVVVSESLASGIQNIGNRKIVDNSVFLPASLRADFIDCSKWVEETIKSDGNYDKAKEEFAKLQKTSMRIYITRDFEKIKERAKIIEATHPEWKYGLLVSNFAEAKVLTKEIGWELGYGKNNNTVDNGEYGQWFTGDCKLLNKACSVYGNQGLELDCPIIIFGCDYIRKDGTWIAQGWQYNNQKENFEFPKKIVENNYRVLLTRARKEMILFVPCHQDLDETYNYFVEMGMDVL